MKRMMAIAAMLVACGGASEMETGTIEAALRGCGQGSCIVDVNGVELGYCGGNLRTLCGGSGTGCLAGRHATTVSTDACGNRVSENNCPLPIVLCK